jgi:hypothetical protein
MSTEPAPIILIDAPEDGVAEERAWVEATVDREGLAVVVAGMERDQLLCEPEEFRFAVDDASRVTLAPSVPPEEQGEEHARWNEPQSIEAELRCAGIPAEQVAARLSEAREFWRVPVVEVADA